MTVHFALPKILTRAPVPGVRAFAFLAGIEAVVRGIVLSVYPLMMYRAYGDAAVVSQFYFGVGLLSLVTALLVPLATRIDDWLGNGRRNPAKRGHRKC